MTKVIHLLFHFFFDFPIFVKPTLTFLGSDKVTNDWNFHRKKTLHQTIQSHILPTFFRQLSSMLLEETTENIIRECVQKLEGYLSFLLLPRVLNPFL